MNPNAEKDTAMVQEYQNNLISGDIEKVARYLHDDLVVQRPRHKEPKNKTEELEAWKNIHLTSENIRLEDPVFTRIRVNFTSSKS